MFWLKISFLLFLAHNVHADGPCIFQNACICKLSDSAVIDLTTAGTQTTLPLFYEVFIGNIGNVSCGFIELYSYNPCFPFKIARKDTEVKPPACVGAAACVKVPAGSGGGLAEEHAIGLQHTALFGGNDGDNMYIEYTVPDKKTKLKVHLTCGTGDGSSLTLIKPECSGDEVELNFTSKCACPNGCPSATIPVGSSGMSTGSKLLIAFFTILVAYLIVGVLWNFCNGAQGAEIVPNLAFWTDLPTLIMEGVTFTFSCCSRKSTYGEV